jgi:hypothetical protein
VAAREYLRTGAGARTATFSLLAISVVPFSLDNGAPPLPGAACSTLIGEAGWTVAANDLAMPAAAL